MVIIWALYLNRELISGEKDVEFKLNDTSSAAVYNL